jgi:hypothetical protein
MRSSDKAFEPVFKSSDVEVNEKSLPHVGQLHVSEQLHVVDGKQVVDTFEFKDDLVFHQDIDAVPTVQSQAFVIHGERILQQEGDFVQFQFVGETLFVSRFQEPGAECAMDLDGTADDAVGQLGERHGGDYTMKGMKSMKKGALSGPKPFMSFMVKITASHPVRAGLLRGTWPILWRGDRERSRGRLHHEGHEEHEERRFEWSETLHVLHVLHGENHSFASRAGWIVAKDGADSVEGRPGEKHGEDYTMKAMKSMKKGALRCPKPFMFFMSFMVKIMVPGPGMA